MRLQSIGSRGGFPSRHSWKAPSRRASCWEVFRATLTECRRTPRRWLWSRRRLTSILQVPCSWHPTLGHIIASPSFRWFPPTWVSPKWGTSPLFYECSTRDGRSPQTDMPCTHELATIPKAGAAGLITFWWYPQLSTSSHLTRSLTPQTGWTLSYHRWPPLVPPSELQPHRSSYPSTKRWTRSQ